LPLVSTMMCSNVLMIIGPVLNFGGQCARSRGELQVGPGSAAHRHGASKTRVNALMALRSVRGTRPIRP
jgi:hypothetical protein